MGTRRFKSLGRLWEDLGTTPTFLFSSRSRGFMSYEIALDDAVISTLQSMARQGRTPSEMLRELKRCLGRETHIVTLLNYFRRAFSLTLADPKPIATLSRNEQRDVDDKDLFDELLLPAILSHRSDWERREP